jgi:hypothetical protein
MEWLKRLTVDARRDERTIKSALSALSLSGEFLENGVIGMYGPPGCRAEGKLPKTRLSR